MSTEKSPSIRRSSRILRKRSKVSYDIDSESSLSEEWEPPAPSKKKRRLNKSITKNKKTAKTPGTEKNELKTDDKKIAEDGREKYLLDSVQNVLELPGKDFETGVTRIFNHQIKTEIISKRRYRNHKNHPKKASTKAGIGNGGYLAFPRKTNSAPTATEDNNNNNSNNNNNNSSNNNGNDSDFEVIPTPTATTTIETATQKDEMDHLIEQLEQSSDQIKDEKSKTLSLTPTYSPNPLFESDDSDGTLHISDTNEDIEGTNEDIEGTPEEKKSEETDNLKGVGIFFFL